MSAEDFAVVREIAAMNASHPYVADVARRALATSEQAHTEEGA